MDRQADARMAYTAHGFFFDVVVGCRWMDHIAGIPASPHFSFLCLLPRYRPLGYSSWSGAPNYTSRVTDENDRPAVPFGDVLCPEKGYQYTRPFFLGLPLSFPFTSFLRHRRQASSLVLSSMSSSLGSLSTSFLHCLPLKALCPWAGVHGYFIHRMLFNLGVTYSLFLFLSAWSCLSLSTRCFSFVLKCF